MRLVLLAGMCCHLSYTSPNPPSSHYMYRVLLRDRMEQLADEIVRKLPKT